MTCIDYSQEQIIIIISLLILLILASWWEYKDYSRIKSRPYLSDIKSSRERKKELEFHACFNSRNNVQWRGIFIMTLVATLLVSYIVIQFYPDKPINMNLILLVFGAIILVFYIGNTVRTHHLYGDMCARVRSDKNMI